MSLHPNGPALGMFPEEFGIGFETVALRLHAGTQLLLHTDGVSEACNAENEEFGFGRIRQTWERERLPPEAFVNVLREQVRQFVGRAEQYDDLTLVAIDFSGPPREDTRNEDEERKPSNVRNTCLN